MIERIVDSGLVPEPVLRAGIRAVCALRLREQRRADQAAFVASHRGVEFGDAARVHRAHRRYAYPFDDNGPSDWMAREFFTGGIMPSADLLPRFDADLRVAEAWQLDGTHYARTAEAWHANLVAQRAAIENLLGRHRYQRWRVFFLACAELFGYSRGREWIVAHYRFVAQRGT